jgi:hypothetical protein
MRDGLIEKDYVNPDIHTSKGMVAPPAAEIELEKKSEGIALEKKQGESK